MDNGGAFTDRLLEDAGIGPGQTALDVGCGSGQVSFRLAKRVGPAGQVIGVDLNPSALQFARERAQQAGTTNVTFVEADLHDLPPPPTPAGFDVVTCRRVLMYLPDKVQAVRAMLAALRPGGRLALQEHDASGWSDAGYLPLNETANRLMWDTVRAEGGDAEIGRKLHAILTEAGAEQVEISAEAIVQTADQSSPTAMIIEAMADRIVARGVAARDDIDALDIRTLADRLTEERRVARASFIGETIFGALAFKPDSTGTHPS